MKTKWMAVVAATVLLAGCKPANEPPPVQMDRGTAPRSQGIEVGGGGGRSQEETKAAFLNRIRQSDPQFRTIERAMLNERNELGLILDRSVEVDSVPALMRTMLTQMSREFPGQDLTVVAYAPTQPPMEIGTARLNAQTRQMTYTRAR